tara:strand:- start:7705 stop:8226 length:522 start_codon:yes stop_codon:yes gene_type:complete
MYDNKEISDQVLLDVVDCVRKLLPCKQCKMHFTQQLRLFDVMAAIQSNSTFEWSYYLHGAVNKQLGKSSTPPISLQDCLAYYRIPNITSLWYAMFIVLAPMLQKLSTSKQFLLQRFFSSLNFLFFYWRGPIPLFLRKKDALSWVSVQAKRFVPLAHYMQMRKIAKSSCKECNR